jgi:hypothetical protein
VSREWRVSEALDPSNVGLPFDRRGNGDVEFTGADPERPFTSPRRKKEANDGDTQWQR